MTDMTARRWGCPICSYAYDSTRGDPDHGIPPGTPFADLPEEWVCPWCGAPKEDFFPESE